MSARESRPRITGKHHTWESSNNAQRLSHNVPGGNSRGQTRSTGAKRGAGTPPSLASSRVFGLPPFFTRLPHVCQSGIHRQELHETLSYFRHTCNTRVERVEVVLGNEIKAPGEEGAATKVTRRP